MNGDALLNNAWLYLDARIVDDICGALAYELYEQSSLETIHKLKTIVTTWFTMHDWQLPALNYKVK